MISKKEKLKKSDWMIVFESTISSFNTNKLLIDLLI